MASNGSWKAQKRKADFRESPLACRVAWIHGRARSLTQTTFRAGAKSTWGANWKKCLERQYFWTTMPTWLQLASAGEGLRRESTILYSSRWEPALDRVCL